MMPVILAGAAAIAVWLLILGFNSRRSLTERRHRRRAVHGEEAGAASGAGRGNVMGSLRRRRSALVSARKRSAEARARVLKFMVVLLAIGAVGALIGFVVFSTIGAAAGGAIGVLGPLFLRRQRRSSRAGKINGQLPEILQSLSGGLRAGQTFVQSIDSAGRDAGEPIRSELMLLMRELELGVPMEEALENLRIRVGDQDFDLVVDAVLIQRQIGGNLAEVLGNIAVTIRERIRIRGEVKSLTGQARLSGWVLSLLPLFVGTIMYLLSPEYMDPLINRDLGRLLIGAAVVSELIGMFIIRRIANVRV